MTQATSELAARRRLQRRGVLGSVRSARPYRRFLDDILASRAGLSFRLQSFHRRARSGDRHRHRFLADGGARDRRNEFVGRLDRRVRGRCWAAFSCSRWACQFPSPWSARSALGAALGWLNGLVITRTGVNSFIVTLASANLYSGAMLIVTKAVPLDRLPPEVGAFGKLKIAGVLSPLLLIAVAIVFDLVHPLPLSPALADACSRRGLTRGRRKCRGCRLDAS